MESLEVAVSLLSLPSEVTEEEPSEHPLLNSLVLNGVFKHLGVDDLKSCRLVCRDWHGASTIRFRKCVKIYIDNENSMEEYENLSGLHKVKSFRLNFYCNDGILLLTKFLDSPNTSALRELTLTCLHVTYEIRAFLSCLPLLENLTFVRPRNQTGCLLNPIPAKTRFDKEGVLEHQFVKLKRLVCWNISTSTMEFGNLRGILLAAPNLREIVTNDDDLIDVVWRNLDIWSNTLECLVMGFLQGWYNSLPLNKSLTLSKLSRFSVVGGGIRCPDSSWAPNLKVVVFSNICMDVLFPDDLDTTTVKALQIENTFIGQWAGFTSKRFPFLKLLIFPLMIHALFRMVCKNLKTIEELHVGSEILDSSITGFPRYRRHTWHGITENVKAKRAFTVGNYRKYAYVADLPGLKRIIITRNNRLTEACILLGLVHCKSLETIKIDGMREISIVTIRALASKLPGLKLLNLRTNNLHGDEGSVAVAYINKKLPNCIVQF